MLKTPKQNEVIQWTLEAVPTHWIVKKNPSTATGKEEVSLKLEAMPDSHELSMIREKVKATIGCALDVIL